MEKKEKIGKIRGWAKAERRNRGERKDGDPAGRGFRVEIRVEKRNVSQF